MFLPRWSAVLALATTVPLTQGSLPPRSAAQPVGPAIELRGALEDQPQSALLMGSCPLHRPAVQQGTDVMRLRGVQVSLGLSVHAGVSG
jgi:hypothetical protein